MHLERLYLIIDTTAIDNIPKDMILKSTCVGWTSKIITTKQYQYNHVIYNNSTVQISNMRFTNVKGKKVNFGCRILILMLVTSVNCNKPSFWIFAVVCLFPGVD